jgi:hypothetical protein
MFFIDAADGADVDCGCCLSWCYGVFDVLILSS